MSSFWPSLEARRHFKCAVSALLVFVTFAAITGCESTLSVQGPRKSSADATAAPGATASPTPVPAVVPAVLSFSSPSQSGSFAYKTTNDLTFTVSNSGPTAATSVSFATVSTPYSVVSNTCGGTIAAGGSCQYVLRFTSPGQRTSGSGGFTTTLTASYSNGVTSATATKAVSQTGTPATATVNALYSNAQKWTAYVENDGAQITVSNGTGIKDILKATNVACTGSESGGYSACIHGGELKKVVLTGDSCSGLTLTENLGGVSGTGAFNWKCVDSGGNANFYSTGLQETKGLRDLVNATSWKNNAVTISDGTYTRYQSTAGAWWTNTVVAAPSADGALPATQWVVYTVSSDTSHYYTFNSANTALVTLNGAVMTNGTSNVSVNVGTAGFAWIEANGTGSTAYGFVSDGVFTVIRNSKISGGAQGFEFDGDASNGLIYRSSFNDMSGTAGLLYSAPNVTLFKVSAANSSSLALSIANGTSGAVLTQVTGMGNAGSFVNVSGASTYTTISHLTAINNAGSAVKVLPYSFPSASTGTVDITQAMAANNGSGGFSFINVTGSAKNLVSTNNVDGIKMTSNASVYFTGNLLLGNNSNKDCNTNSWVGANGVYDSAGTCTAQGGSTTTPSQGHDLTSTFVGQTSTTSAYASLSWFSLATDFSFWGTNGFTFPSASQRAPCTSGTCSLWDLRLSSSDTVSLDAMGAFTANVACPTAAYDTTTNSAGTTYLTNAVELMGYGGNQNGLCESGETCVYQPNYGSYLGEGSYAGTCTFNPASGNSVQGVTMYGYATNGATP